MEEDQLKKFKNHSKRSKKVGRMEEAVVVKKKRFQARIFFSFSIKYWKNGRREINIFSHFPQNIKRMEEAVVVQEEKYLKFIFQIFYSDL
jgi:hypothetical protein